VKIHVFCDIAPSRLVDSYRHFISRVNKPKRLLYPEDEKPVDCVWNVMAHEQKPDLVFRRNGRAHLNRRGRQVSRLLAAEVCASAVVMLDTPRSEVVWEYWLPTPFASFSFTSPPVRHRVPSHFKRTLTTYQLTRPNFTENFNLQEQRPENLKSWFCNFVSNKWTTRF